MIKISKDRYSCTWHEFMSPKASIIRTAVIITALRNISKACEFSLKQHIK